MIVYRFCSFKELEALRRGRTLTNTKDHYRGGAGGSTSVGFCFTTDPPQTALKYLKGIVCPEVVVKYNIPRKMLTKTSGKYLKKATETVNGLMLTSEYRTEYCMTKLSLKEVELLEAIPLSNIIDGVTLAALRHLYGKL